MAIDAGDGCAGSVVPAQLAIRYGQGAALAGPHGGEQILAASEPGLYSGHAQQSQDRGLVAILAFCNYPRLRPVEAPERHDT